MGTMDKVLVYTGNSLTTKGSQKMDSCLVLTECLSRRILRFRTPPIELTNSESVERSVMIRREICPIRAEISTHQTWGKIVYFLFVWLVGISFRQNFFRVLPNFGDFGTKMSFYHYIINQKRNNFIKTLFPPVYQEAADIRDVYLYKKFAVQVGSWYTGGGGGRCSIDKKPKGCRLKTHKIRYSQCKIASIVHILIKAWNFA